MSCQHHPEYEPSSGEPTFKLEKLEGGYIYPPTSILSKPQQVIADIPCPWCWQARAEHIQLNHDILVTLMDKFEERIKELEADGEQVKALEFYADPCTWMTWQHLPNKESKAAKDRGVKARAALGERVLRLTVSEVKDA